MGRGWGGSGLVHTPIALNILAHDYLGLVPPLIQLEKGRVNFGASKKSLAGFPASAAATTRSKLSCGNLALIGSNPARAQGAYGRKVPEFLNPTKEHGFIQPQSGGMNQRA